VGRKAVEAARKDLLRAGHAAVAGIPKRVRESAKCAVYTTMEPCATRLGAFVYTAIDCIVWQASDTLTAYTSVEITRY
jgi:tRNA(Arg) A34 adenosine deaminase TadA